MPLTSHVSADEDFRGILDAADAELARTPPPRRAHRPSTMALWPEAAHNIARYGFEPVVAWLRKGWLYRLTLRGPVPDRVIFYPHDPSSRRLDDADAMFRGRFAFGGEALDVKEGSVFDFSVPSTHFSAALHAFDWLRHLEAAGSDAARELAQKVSGEWLARYWRYSEPAWLPEIIARRFVNLFAHGRFFLHGSDVMWRSKLFVSLRNQARVLARRMRHAPEGLPRFESASGLALAGVCLSDTRNMQQGLAQLDVEIGRQILPDGGHKDRSPQSLLRAFLCLTMVQQALDATNKPVSNALRSARDRMAPMIRFFRLGDGGLACFNGGNECDARLVSALLASDDAKGMPFGHARYSAYQRMAAGRTFVLLDTGIAPPGAFSAAAHAGCLSFEMSAGAQRMVVNCGAAMGGNEQWREVLRATAAHSTLTLADTSSAAILPPGLVRDLLGPRLVGGSANIETRRNDSGQGILVEASHDGYLARFGIVHERRMALSPKGIVLTGADRLVPLEPKKGRRHGREALPFAIRFHVHPDVRLSFAQAGGTVLLKLPAGEGWRFRAAGGEVGIEESIYFGSGLPRKSEQIVVTGTVRGDAVDCDWLFEQVGAS
ncbi:MAG: heparinase II/III family protein [Alphaproteobacteria bacterium]